MPIDRFTIGTALKDKDQLAKLIQLRDALKASAK